MCIRDSLFTECDDLFDWAFASFADRPLVDTKTVPVSYTHLFLFPGQYANVMGYAIVVSVSLFFSVILAKLVGGMLPLSLIHI